MNRSYSYFKSYKVWPALYQISISMPPYVLLAACPQVFSSGGTCTLLPSFLGVHQNCWGCNVPSNSSFGGTKIINCIFSTQGRAFCILRVIDTGLSLLYRVGENFFFLSDIGSDKNWGSVCLCVCLTIFL